MVARLGGEEFVVLLPDTDLAGAQAIAHTLVAAMDEQLDPVVGHITISAGVATLKGADQEGADILRRADAALYEAKGQGRNRVCVEN
ncbi:putative diguanylate cyclase YdaM [compost metagenome]